LLGSSARIPLKACIFLCRVCCVCVVKVAANVTS
jgi:hypothetical protein